MHTPKFDTIVDKLLSQGLLVQVVDTTTPQCPTYTFKKHASVGFQHVAQVWVLRSNGEEFVTTNPAIIRNFTSTTHA